MCAVVVAQIVAVDGTNSELACQSSTEVSPVELGELGTMFRAKFGASNSVIAAATLSVLCVFCFWVRLWPQRGHRTQTRTEEQAGSITDFVHMYDGQCHPKV